jgi:hypothetical protein
VSSSTPCFPRVVGLRRGTSGASGLNRNLGPCLFFRDSAGSRGPSRIGWGPKVLPSTFGLLSWGSSKIAPPPVQMSCVHSRIGRGLSFGSKLPRSELVPPLPFLSASAVYSARHPAGLLHPATSHGVRHVSGPPLPFARRRQGGVFLSRGALPYEAFPSATARCASPRSAALSPLFPVAGRGSARVATVGPAPFRRSLDLRVLVRREVRCKLDSVAAGEPPDAPLGLVPRRARDASSRRRSEDWRSRLAPL